MKGNFILLSLLTALIVGTYFFQEKRVEKEHVESDEATRLIKDEIVQIKTSLLDAKKIKDQWWMGKELLSHNSMKQMEEKLRTIKKLKNITGEWATYFSHPVTFEVNGIKYTLGEMTLDKQGFYIAKDKEIMVGVIEGENVELTRDENELAKIKLNELYALLAKSPDEMYEKQFFRFYPEFPSEKVLVEADGNLGFELDFKHNKTIPPPIPGIKEHDSIFDKFRSILTLATLKNEVPFDEKLKGHKIASLTFIEGPKKLVWELWLKNTKSSDSILIDPQSRRAFSMVGGTLRVFFIQVQDYWDKKVIPHDAFKDFNKVGATFYQGTKSANVSIQNREPLVFEAQGFKANAEALNNIFQFIFNLGPKDQADRVSLLSKSEKQQLLSGDFLRIAIMNQELLLWPKKEELIVVNLTQGFKAHFSVLMENSSIKFEDMLK